MLRELNGGSLIGLEWAEIVRGQIASEEALARDADRVLICDTDPLATTVWAEFLAGGCPQELRDLARRPYDLTLLTTPDVPWDADDGRCVPGRDCNRHPRGPAWPLATHPTVRAAGLRQTREHHRTRIHREDHAGTGGCGKAPNEVGLECRRRHAQRPRGHLDATRFKSLHHLRKALTHGSAQDRRDRQPGGCRTTARRIRRPCNPTSASPATP